MILWLGIIVAVVGIGAGFLGARKRLARKKEAARLPPDDMYPLW